MPSSFSWVQLISLSPIPFHVSNMLWVKLYRIWERKRCYHCFSCIEINESGQVSEQLEKFSRTTRGSHNDDQRYINYHRSILGLHFYLHAYWYGALFSTSSIYRLLDINIQLALRSIFKRIYCASEWWLDQYLLQSLPSGRTHFSHHLFHLIGYDWTICAVKLDDCYNHRKLWVSFSQEWLSQ